MTQHWPALLKYNYLKNYEYSGKSGKKKVDINMDENTETEFLKSIRNILKDMHVEFRVDKSGDALDHILLRFKLIYTTYQSFKRDIESMSLEELKEYVDRFSKLFDFSVYKTDYSIYDILINVQRQVDDMTNRKLQYVSLKEEQSLNEEEQTLNEEEYIVENEKDEIFERIKAHQRQTQHEMNERYLQVDEMRREIDSLIREKAVITDRIQILSREINNILDNM